jgi:betaine-aldehyde dehydrogenase
VGAIASEQQYNKILDYIDQARRARARLQLGGEPLQILDGRFIATTVFDEVHPDMAIAREEIFGPVLSILTFDTAEEAIGIANSTNYGLSSGIWTCEYTHDARFLDTARQTNYANELTKDE